MLDWKGVAGAAAVAVLAVAGLARAEDTSVSNAVPRFLPADRPLFLDDAMSMPSTAPAPAPAAKRPLMALLGMTPVGGALDKANINIFGWFEGGYTFSFSNPPGGLIGGNVFNTAQARAKLDQADINFQRTVDPAAAAKAHTFDVGGQIELLYGYDGVKIHSNGMGIYGGGGVSSSGRQNPEDQFDPLQAFVDVAIPVGNGLMVRAGKFVTLLGEEVIDAPSNALYSHSYLFGYAIPFTQTGVLGKYALNDQWTVWGGITRGWNQSLKDNNGAIDFLGEGRLDAYCQRYLPPQFCRGVRKRPRTTATIGRWRISSTPINSMTSSRAL